MGLRLLLIATIWGGLELVPIKTISIGGLSGIYVEHQFDKNRPSPHAFDIHSNKDYIHFIEEDVDKLLRFESCDILLLHEWPTGIILSESTPYNWDGEIGNEYSQLLIEALQPKIVFCGHMHHFSSGHIQVAPDKQIPIYCLGYLNRAFGSIAVFEMGRTEIKLIYLQ